MTNTVDCPHTMPLTGRACAGCTETAEDSAGDRTVERWCEGEITGKVIHDSDGDPGVIKGIRHFLTVEDLELSCGCILTAAEEQKVTDALCEAYVEDDGSDDDYYAGLADAASY